MTNNNSVFVPLWKILCIEHFYLHVFQCHIIVLLHYVCFLTPLFLAVAVLGNNLKKQRFAQIGL